MEEKLTSRKFWVAIISIIVGILGVFGVADSTIETISSLTLILVPGIVYIFSEAKVDAAAAARQIDLEALFEILDEYYNVNGENAAAMDAASHKTGDRGSGEKPPNS